MKIIRFFFTKQGEAAYISHLDLQRVMARALRRSGIPVWYSQGFNPHIYMTFSLPLSLMQESICETMDCKTEAEDIDFSIYIPLLNKALPKGIEVQKIAPPVFGANEISDAEYQISYPDNQPQFEKAVEQYNKADSVMVVRRTKRTEQEIDLKETLPQLVFDENKEVYALLPAGTAVTFNPDLLIGFFEKEAGMPAGAAQIVRQKVFTVDGKEFC